MCACVGLPIEQQSCFAEGSDTPVCCASSADSFFEISLV